MERILEGDVSSCLAVCHNQSGTEYKEFPDGIRPDYVIDKSISYLIYKNGMDGGQFGFQSANAVIFFLVIVAISVFQLTVMNKKEGQL